MAGWKRHRLGLLAACLAFSASVLANVGAYAAHSPRGASDTRWEARFSAGAGHDRITAAELSPDGTRLFATGAVGATGEFLTIAFDANTGRRLWTMRSTSPGHSHIAARSITVGSGGARVFVAGRGQRADGDAVWIVLAYDAATGTSLWASRYHPPRGLRLFRPSDYVGTERSEGILPVMAAAGRVVIAGNLVDVQTDDAYPAMPAVAIAFRSADGAPLWQSIHSFHTWADAQRGALVWSSALAPNGKRAYLGIQVDETPNCNSEGILAIGTRNGARLWRSYNVLDDDCGGQHPTNLALAPDGHLAYIQGTAHCCFLGPLLSYGTTQGRMWFQKELAKTRYRPAGRLEELLVTPGSATVLGTGIVRRSTQNKALVFAVDATTRYAEWRWRRSVFTARRPISGVDLSMTASGTVALVTTAALDWPRDEPQPTSPRLIALDVDDGSELWSRRVPVVSEELFSHPTSDIAFIVGRDATNPDADDIVMAVST